MLRDFLGLSALVTIGKTFGGVLNETRLGRRINRINEAWHPLIAGSTALAAGGLAGYLGLGGMGGAVIGSIGTTWGVLMLKAYGVIPETEKVRPLQN